MTLVDMTETGLTPLAGGFSGETFLAQAAGERSVVRIYAGPSRRRGPAAVDVDAAVLRLVAGLLPVPEVLEVRRPDEHRGTPGVLVTSYLKGTRLDLVLGEADRTLRTRIGHHLGAALAVLGGIALSRAGMFLDGALTLGALPASDLVTYVETAQRDTALAGWSPEDQAALLLLAEGADEREAASGHRVCLVHSDLNPKNVLVDAATGEITGLLDWEFAHAGSPFTDLGNLLRFERDPTLRDAVLEALLDRCSTYDSLRTLDHGALLDRARAADLWALVDLAGRGGANDIALRAGRLLLAMARSTDLHAVPDPAV